MKPALSGADVVESEILDAITANLVLQLAPPGRLRLRSACDPWMRLPFGGSLNEPRFSNAVASQKRMTYDKGRRKKNEAVINRSINIPTFFS
jgi:hypothetical protein